MRKNLAIVLAGGAGVRIEGDLPKQFLILGGKTILQHSIEKFEHHPGINHMFVVVNGEFIDKVEEIVRKSGYQKVIKIITGGETRQDSSRIGVTAAAGDYENVLIHDAARPFVSKKIINGILETLNRYSAVNVAIPSSDTIIEIDETNFIKDVPDRIYLRRVQTPQAFKSDLIQKAHRLAVENNITDATDDCSLIYVVEGSPLNIKITYPIDLQMAEKILQLESEGEVP
jgi:2-C-methyl-D-erythritol 4-phosphate cytidylyltransferase